MATRFAILCFFFGLFAFLFFNLSLYHALDFSFLGTSTRSVGSISCIADRYSFTDSSFCTDVFLSLSNLSFSAITFFKSFLPSVMPIVFLLVTFLLTPRELLVFTVARFLEAALFILAVFVPLLR